IITSITTQQTKLDLELVPKENQFDIGKCNGRIPRGFSPREPTFQVVLDAVALTPCYLAFSHHICPRVQGQDFDPLPSEEDTVSFLRDLDHNGVINSLNDVVVDQMHQPWRTFDALINRSLSGKTTGLDKLRLSRAQILWGMYHKKNVDYMELLWEDFTYQIDNKEFKKQEKIPTTKESKTYKTFLGFATGTVPPKAARKFKKASPSKKDNVPIPEDEEPVKKGKRLKIAAKKYAFKRATCIVIREPAVETKSKRKEKEKVDVAHRKGIELLSDVALTKEAQMKEITSPITSEGTGDILGVPHVTNDNSSESESESWGNDEDDNNKEHVSSDEGSEEENESDKQASDSEQEEESEDDDQKENKYDGDLELESNDETEGDEEMDDTTDDDADARLEEPTKTTTGIVQGEGTDAKMTESQQGNENLKTTQE
ncbi:hypothetical protein Tco_1435987, partial [Tanacetum coccineum]